MEWIWGSKKKILKSGPFEILDCDLNKKNTLEKKELKEENNIIPEKKTKQIDLGEPKNEINNEKININSKKKNINSYDNTKIDEMNSELLQLIKKNKKNIQKLNNIQNSIYKNYLITNGFFSLIGLFIGYNLFHKNNQ